MLCISASLCVCWYPLFHQLSFFVQEVLTQLTSRLASQLNDLTIQVVKDDWSFPRPSHVSSSPLTGSRLSISPSSPPHPGHTPSIQSQLVGGIGQIKGHPHMHSPPPHHHDNTPSPTLVTPNPHTTASHL